MAKGKINNILIPQINKLPQGKRIGRQDRIDTEGEEFKNLLKERLTEVEKEHGIALSMHAAKRLHERNLSIDSEELDRVKDAIGKLRDKGGQDSLVITSKAAYIIDVNNNKIVTAIDRDGLEDNVFTNIDSTVIV